MSTQASQTAQSRRSLDETSGGARSSRDHAKAPEAAADPWVPACGWYWADDVDDDGDAAPENDPSPAETAAPAPRGAEGPKHPGEQPALCRSGALGGSAPAPAPAPEEDPAAADEEASFDEAEGSSDGGECSSDEDECSSDDDAPPEGSAQPAPTSLAGFEFVRNSAQAVRAPDALPRPKVVWWNGSLPKPTLSIFNDSALAARLCTFCSSMENIKLNTDGEVVRTLCPSCRVVVGHHAPCPKCPGTPNARYVDEVGAIAPVCSACHARAKAPAAKAPAKANRRRGARGGRRARERAARKAAAQRAAAQDS